MSRKVTHAPLFIVLLTSLAAAIQGCSTSRAHASSTDTHESVVELSGEVRVNLTGRFVEFDAQAVAIEDPDVTVPLYLELAVCTWNTREHESLFATAAKPSLIHAGLLLLDAGPGKPGRYDESPDGSLIPVAPTGDQVQLTVQWVDSSGRTRAVAMSRFIRKAPGAERDVEPGQLAWVFAGSRIDHDPPRVINAYAADFTGTVIGLSSFGSEVIAPAVFHSPELAIEPALWIVDFEHAIPQRTPVTIRIQPIN